MITVLVLSLGIGAIAFVGCGGSSDTGSNASCKLSADCPDSEVCLRVGSESTCMLNCTASANECGGSASCEGVGSVGVNVCQEKKEEPSAENPPDPKEEPYLPCASDAECAKLASGAVCGEWHSSRDCTIVCTTDSQCNPPAVGGISTTFFGCQPDESNTKRTVCLPREECFNDPLSCISGIPDGSSGSMGTSSGGFGGFPGM